MSGLPTILKATEEDIKLLLSAQSHLGTKNCDVHMEPYVYKRRADGMTHLRTFCSGPQGELRELGVKNESRIKHLDIDT
jgi:hypothetical protein